MDNPFLVCFLAAILAQLVLFALVFTFQGARRYLYHRRMMKLDPHKRGESAEVTVLEDQTIVMVKPGKPIDVLACDSGCRLDFVKVGGDTDWSGRIVAVRVSEAPSVEFPRS